MLQNRSRCAEGASSDACLSLRRSFELPSDSRWIGLGSSFSRDEGPSVDPCRLPALRPTGLASGKFVRLEERARRKEKSRKRGASVRSKQFRAVSKPRASRPRAGPGLDCCDGSGKGIAGPQSSLSDLSLPSPRANDEVLSASAVLRAALTGSFLDLDDESLDLQLSSDPPYTWSPCSSSQDENHRCKCASSPQPRDVDDYHLSATTLIRCGFEKERVPLSTLQLLEAEVASQSSKPCKDHCRYSLPSDRSDRLPCIEGPSKAVTELSRAGEAAGRNVDMSSDLFGVMAKSRPEESRGRLPSYLRPRPALTEEYGRNCSRPRKKAHKEVRKLQRAQSVS